MKRPAVFFDRDNTLIVADGFLGDPSKVALMPGAAEAVARARSLGFATVVVSNQSGVARGLFDESDVRAVNARIDELLHAENEQAVIDRHEFCPFHPEAKVERFRLDSTLRKPRPGMILQAAEKLALDLSESWLIGDAPRDIEAGAAAGCRTILLRSDEVAQSPAAADELKVQPDCTVSSLMQAVQHIEQNRNGASGAATGRSQPPAGTGSLKLASQAAPPASQSSTHPPTQQQRPTARLEQLAEQILHELRAKKEQDDRDFSVSKLFAGITQILTIALLFLAYIKSRDSEVLYPLLFVSLIFQAMTIALLVMGRQR